MKSFFIKATQTGEPMEWARTMTVGELRAKLAEYPDDMPVLAEWEGTDNIFAPEKFRVGRTTWDLAADADCLFIDVEGRW